MTRTAPFGWSTSSFSVGEGVGTSSDDVASASASSIGRSLNGRNRGGVSSYAFLIRHTLVPEMQYVRGANVPPSKHQGRSPNRDDRYFRRHDRLDPRTRRRGSNMDRRVGKGRAFGATNNGGAREERSTLPRPRLLSVWTRRDGGGGGGAPPPPPPPPPPRRRHSGCACAGVSINRVHPPFIFGRRRRNAIARRRHRGISFPPHDVERCTISSNAAAYL